MNSELFKAILAMDAYNRGYGRGIDALSDANGTQIGNATIFDKKGDVQAQSEGFYAIAYNYNGETIISYRGTDLILVNPWGADGSDLVNGYAVGGGFPMAPQADLAIEFYRTVANAQGLAPHDANISLTGHSLGGGLAGLVGSLFGKVGVLFNNMAFEDAADVTYAIAADPYGYATDAFGFLDNNLLQQALAIRNLIYGSATPWENSNTGLYSLNTEGEFLGYLDRQFQVTQQTAYSLGDSGLDPIQLHNMANLVIAKYANALPSAQDWLSVSQYFMQDLYNNDIATAIGANAFNGTLKDHGNFAEIMRTAVAYSAIDEGGAAGTVFGDTGISALFNDANQLGKIVSATGVSTFMQYFVDPIAKIFVQFAGKLAIDKVLKDNSPTAVDGVLTLSGDATSLDINFANSLWASTTNIIGRTELFNIIFVGNSFAAAHETTSVQALWGDSSYTVFDHVMMATKDTGGTFTLSTAPASGKANIFIGSLGADNVTGSSGNDLLIGYGGDDTLGGGNGSDILSGGAGDDSMDGGAGVDTASYAYASSGVTVSLTTGLGSVASGDSDTLSNIENVTGSEYDDNIVGNTGNNVLTGGGGIDTLVGGGGNDTLTGGSGNDNLNGGTGNDTLEGDAGTDTYILSLDGTAGFDTIVDSDGLGVLQDTANTLEQFTGTATRISANDWVFTSSTGKLHTLHKVGDAVMLDNTVLIKDFVPGQTKLGITLEASIGTNSYTINGTNGDDGITGTSGTNIINGFGGSDYLNGSGGHDFLYGGDGYDTLFGDFGNDVLYSGNNKYNYLDGGFGNDVLVSELKTYTDTPPANWITNWGNGDVLDGGGGGSDIFRILDQNQVTASIDMYVRIVNFGIGDRVDLSALKGVDSISDPDLHYDGTSSSPQGTMHNYSYGKVHFQLTTQLAASVVIFHQDVFSQVSESGSTMNIASAGGADYNLATGQTVAVTSATASGTDGYNIATIYNYNYSTGSRVDISQLGNFTNIGTAAFTANSTPQLQVLSQAGSTMLGLDINGDALLDMQLLLVGVSSVGSNDIIMTSNAATSGNDTLTGTTGNDTINGLAGNDTLNAGAGNDTLIGGAGNDVLNGGDGTDTIDYSYVTGNGISVNMEDGTVNAGTGDQDTFTGIENFIGSAQTDFFLVGGGGNKVVNGGGGDDMFEMAGAGVHTVYSTGADSKVKANWTGDAQYMSTITEGGVQGILISNNLTGSAERTTKAFGVGRVELGGGNDVVTITSLASGNPLYSIDTGGGNDTVNLTGVTRNMDIYGGRGNETLTGGSGNDNIHGFEDNDIITGGAGKDNMWGDSEADTFVFTSTSDSGIGSGNRDIIFDYSQLEGDKIDLSGFAGTFDFLGTGAFTGGSSPEVRYEFDGNNTIVKVDSDHNMAAEFEIQLSGNIALTSGDFLL